MPFEKKHTINKGKSNRKGTKNKTTIVKEMIMDKAFNKIGDYFESGEYAERIITILQTSTDADLIKNSIALLEFFKPKLARTETELKVNTEEIDISLKID